MATELAVTWGKRLRDERVRKDVSVLELSRHAEVSPQYIYMLEAGRYSPSDDLRLKIAAALEVRVEDIWSYPEAS
jgi:DNA-binding XRE family transcriptional regulator